MGLASRIIGRLNRYRDAYVIRRFHEIVYYRKLWYTTHWMGHRVMQYPTDLVIKQELLFSIKPDLLIECGTAHGGSSLFYAHMFDLIGNGRIVSIDIEDYPNRPTHPRIEYIKGSTIDPAIIERIATIAKTSPGPTMVVLDSRHTRDHVLSELEDYHSLVTPGSYLIVEDGDINGHPVFTDWEPDSGPGPFEAIQEFLSRNRQFAVDKNCERYLMSHHPSGYLKRLDP